MDAELLLLELADLPVAARMARLTQLGRDRAAAPVLAAWENGDGFERRLSLQSCYGSRDGARVARMASDGSRLTRNLALTIAADVCDDAQLDQIFAPLAEKSRRHVLVLLLRKGRRDAANALIEAARKRGQAWQTLLYLGSQSLVERHFDEAYANANANDWSRLARSHPQWALEKLSARAAALTAPDDTLRVQANAALSVAAARASDAALELIRLLAQHEPLARLQIAALLSFRPLEVARLILENDEAPESRAPVATPWGYFRAPSLGVQFARVAARLPLQTLLELARRRPGTLDGLASKLKSLAPAVRGQLFDELGRAWREGNGQSAAHIVQMLPSPQRQNEARRDLELPSLVAEPLRWLPYAAFLPPDEMRARVEPLLGDPDPDLRAAALGALIGSLRFHFERADEVLALVEARRHEQDPVRGAMFGALSQLPPSRWQGAQLESLARAIQHGLDARDLSASTSGAMQRLVVGALPFAPEWAARELALLVKERGTLSVYNLESRLSDAQMQVVGAALAPVLEIWLEREGLTFISAFSIFGWRLRKWDAGAALLARATSSAATIASSAAMLLYRQRRADFGALVPQLLKRDRSWGTQAAVYAYVGRDAPNLLTTAMLGRDSIKGKFWTGRTRFVLPKSRGFAQWTPDQQRLFALTQGEIIRDAGRDLPAAIRAIDVLAALPDIAPDALIELASLENTRLALREAALRELCQLDAGGGVPTLIEALDDERARIAIYGLRKALLEMPAARALEILRSVSLQKVTVAKEVVRLLADLGSDAAFDFLLEMAARELHRDVRVALGRALWEHLDDARSWPILDESARSEDAAIARMAARTTAPRLSRESKTKLAALLAQLLRHGEARVRLEALANPSLSLLETAGELRAGLFAALASDLPAEYRAAATAICASAAARDASLAAAAIGQLLPRRRALGEVLASLSHQVTSRRHFAAVTRAILNELARDPLTLGEQIGFAWIGLSESEWAARIESDLESSAWHAGALQAAIEVLSNPFNPLTAAHLPTSESGLVERWQSANAPELRRLALAALVGQATENRGEGWTNARLSRLEKLRADAAPLVAAAAQWTFPGDETA